MAPTAGGETPERAGEVAELRKQIAQLQAESAMRESQARQSAYSEAEAKLRAELEAPLADAAAALAGRVEELAGLRRKLRREAEEDLVRLAVAIARRVLHRELTTDPGAMLGVVKAALDRIEARELLQVRVHPADANLVAEAIRSRNVPDQVEVQADSSLERGGLVVETARGALDASIETQLREIERGFTDLMRRSQG